MARIVGAIASSHTPTIGFAYDGKRQDDPVWAPIFEAFGQGQSLEEFQKTRNAPGVLYSVAGAGAKP
jgi:hypothetical protein